MMGTLDFFSEERNPQTYAQAPIEFLPQKTYTPEPVRHAFSPKRSSPLAMAPPLAPVFEFSAAPPPAPRTVVPTIFPKPPARAPPTTIAVPNGFSGFRNVSDPAKVSTSHTLLSPSAPAFTPSKTSFPVPGSHQLALEQLIMRADRLQNKQEQDRAKTEQDRQLLMQFVGRETENRKEIVTLRGQATENRKEIASLRQEVEMLRYEVLGLKKWKNAPAARIVSQEIGASWYGK